MYYCRNDFKEYSVMRTYKRRLLAMKSDRRKLWVDGEFIDENDAVFNVLSHALHYGTGVFEGIRSYSTNSVPAIFRLDDHLKRLLYSAECLNMQIPFSEIQIKEAIIRLVNENVLVDCYIRPIAFFGSGKMGLFPNTNKISVAIACWQWALKDGASNGVRVCVSSFIKPHPISAPLEAKISGNYVNSVLAHQEARRRGFDEDLLLDYRGYVAEGPGENIFLVKNKILITPSRNSILPGITRDSIMNLARDNGLRVIEQNVLPEDLIKVDELFFVGTAAEIWPIVELNGIEIGNGGVGPITSELKGEYQELVRGGNTKYLKWLTLVN